MTQTRFIGQANVNKETTKTGLQTHVLLFLKLSHINTDVGEGRRSGWGQIKGPYVLRMTASQTGSSFLVIRRSNVSFSNTWPWDQALSGRYSRYQMRYCMFSSPREVGSGRPRSSRPCLPMRLQGFFSLLLASDSEVVGTRTSDAAAGLFLPRRAALTRAHRLLHTQLISLCGDVKPEESMLGRC